MFVIVKTDNRQRGDDTILAVYGPYQTEDEALEINAELRAYLPEQYASHDDYPIDHGVWPVEEAE